MILFTAARLSRSEARAKNAEAEAPAPDENDPEAWSFADRDRMQIALFRRDMQTPKTIAMIRCGKRVRVADEI